MRRPSDLGGGCASPTATSLRLIWRYEISAGRDELPLIRSFSGAQIEHTDEQELIPTEPPPLAEVVLHG
jgi:hypothetical protein